MDRLLGSSVFEVAVTLGGGAGASRTLVKASVPLFDSTVAGVRVAAVKLAVLLLRAGLVQRSCYDKVRTAQQKELDAALAAAAHVPAQAPAEAALPSAREEGRRCGAVARQTRCLGRSGCECSDCEAEAVTAKALEHSTNQEELRLELGKLVEEAVPHRRTCRKAGGHPGHAQQAIAAPC